METAGVIITVSVFSMVAMATFLGIIFTPNQMSMIVILVLVAAYLIQDD